MSRPVEPADGFGVVFGSSMAEQPVEGFERHLHSYLTQMTNRDKITQFRTGPDYRIPGILRWTFSTLFIAFAYSQ